jgi:hypothetical protein
MPDPLFLLGVMAGAAVAAAVAVLLCSRPLRAPNTAWVAAGEAVGIGLVFLAGCLVLGNPPHWPPADAHDRLLLGLLPAVVLVEVVAALRAVPPWLAWGLRLVVAGGAAPVLLYNSRYLTDSAGPHTRLWTTEQAAAWLGGLALSLALVWVLLNLLTWRSSGRSVKLALALTCAGAAPAIMYSGHVTGGPPLVPLAGGLVGAVLASLAWKVPARGATGGVGVGIVLQFGLLLIGRCFGELTIAHAALLFFAPLLAWLPELLPGTRFPRWVRGGLALVLVAVPVTLAVVQARHEATAPSGPGAPSGEPTLDDYQQFGR